MTVSATPRGDHDEAIAVAEIKERNRVLLAGAPTGGRQQAHVVVHQASTDASAGRPVEDAVERREILRHLIMHRIVLAAASCSRYRSRRNMGALIGRPLAAGAAGTSRFGPRRSDWLAGPRRD
jgi:hypothetical protein